MDYSGKKKKKYIKVSKTKRETFSKTVWKPGTMLYPVPAVLVTSKSKDAINVITVSWAGTVCTNPPMLSISLRPERYSYELIKKSGEFIVNLPGENLATAVDFCGVKSGRDLNKFESCGLHTQQASVVKAPLIQECPVGIEVRVDSIKELGSHHMFIGEVVAVNVETSLIDKSDRLRLDKAKLLCYNHGHYCSVSESLGKFGFSVQKKRIRRNSGIKSF
ncbi:MAG: flavin reductase family protein [Spirochaetes bacterium]|nr:flavin reductase family protein [Spirochaetota bacterium]